MARAKAVAALRSDFYVDPMPAVDDDDVDAGAPVETVERIVRVATSGGSKRFKEWAFDEVPARGPNRASSPDEGGGGADVGAEGVPRGVPMKNDEGPAETVLRPSAACAAATEKYVAQVVVDYRRAMNRCVFDDAIVQPQHGLGSRVERALARGGVAAPVGTRTRS